MTAGAATTDSAAPWGPGLLNLRWMSWCGVLAAVILLLGMWAVAGFVPPPGPDSSVEEIVALYVDNGVRIRFGMIVACAGVTLLAPWVVAIAMQMRRIEGVFAPLAWTQLMLGAVLIVEFYIPCVIWTVAAYRPELDPVLTYRLHDLGSVLFVALPFSAALQAFLLGVAVLQDKHRPPVFGRWLGYLSLWSGLCFLPGAFNSLAKTGVIAWSGVLAWWLGLTVFGIWIVAVSAALNACSRARA